MLIKIKMTSVMLKHYVAVAAARTHMTKMALSRRQTLL